MIHRAPTATATAVSHVTGGPDRSALGRLAASGYSGALQPKVNFKKGLSKAIFVYSRFCPSPTPHRRGAGALSRTYSLTSRPLSGRLSTRQTRKHESGCQQSWRGSHSLTAERSTADAKGRGREVGAGRQLFSSQRRLEVHKIGRRPAVSSALPTRSLVGASFPIEASASSSRTPRRGRRLVARRCRAGAGAAGGRARGRQRCRLDGRRGGEGSDNLAQTASPPRGQRHGAPLSLVMWSE